MPWKELLPNLFALGLGAVNSFLIEGEDLALVDAGFPEHASTILETLTASGRDPRAVRHILVTHCHADHAGGVAELQQATGARTYMHPLDADMVRLGRAKRALIPSPGLLSRLLFPRILENAPETIPPAEIDQEVLDGEVLPIAGGIQAIHTPGHSAGQLAFLWHTGSGVLFAADTASHFVRLDLSLGYEDLQVGLESLARVAELDFETAVFGHGRPILRGASRQFHRKWPSPAGR